MSAKLGLAAIALGALLVSPKPADAQPVPPACSSLSNTIPLVWIENGDTQEPLLKRLGQKLATSATPLRVVYKNRRTCDLANDLYVGNKIVNDAIAIKYIPTPAEDPTWDPSKPAPTCTADAGGNAIELGIGATFLSSCTSLPAKPAGIQVLDGPVQSYGFIVPKGSSQVALTAEEGYFAFGFTQGTGQAAPWTDQALRFVRGPTASTALVTAAAVGLKATQLKGTVPPNNTSSEVLTSVATSANPEATIGLMGTEVYDANRDKVKLLAFKAFGQRYAYYPDKTSTSFDKQNVRDGHYLPWAPTPYILPDTPTANALRVKQLVFGERTDADVNGLDQVVASGLVPECAMKVKRAYDGADLSLYAPPEPCACYFESKVPQGTTACTPCNDDGPCGGGKCRRNFCEVR
jgi:hypothetical protein